MFHGDICQFPAENISKTYFLISNMHCWEPHLDNLKEIYQLFCFFAPYIIKQLFIQLSDDV